MQDEDPEGSYRWIAEELNHFDLAYLHIKSQTAPDDEGVERVTERSEAMSAIIRDAWKGALLICGGFSPEEAATALCLSRRTAARRWAYARAWLIREIREQDSSG